MVTRALPPALFNGADAIRCAAGAVKRLRDMVDGK